ncbi:MAG: hypothetical protein JXR31_04520 [Prolixibacteraceae bacterium]|nr:hypothetical protein [Prolixibacteraceae bacterium]MBN2773488.1 hypothetical protein [Prolixibacteraceae bacterium]
MANSIKKIIFSGAVKGIHNEMNLNPFTLKFPDETESEYKKYHFLYSVDFVRVALLFSMVFYLLFNILDYVVFTENQLLFLLVRIGICIPAAIIILGISKDSFLKRNWQAVLSIMVIIAAAGIILMIILSNKIFQHGYYAGLILVLIFNYFFCRLSFIWASATGWILFSIYLIAELLFFDISFEILFMYAFFLGSANFFGMAGSYFFEYQMRREFYTIQLLEKEKQSVEDLNKNLEIKVADRTAALEKINAELSEKNKSLIAAKKELSEHKTGLEKIVEKRTNELQEKISELENYNQLFVGREFRIKELKDKIHELEMQLNNK